MTNGEILKQMFPDIVFNRVSKSDCVVFDLYCGSYTIFTGCARNGWWDAEYKESEAINEKD